MAGTGNGGMSPEARDNIGVLAQRVVTVEASIQEIRGSFNALNSKMDDQARTQGDKIDTLFRSLDQRLSGQIDSISRELGKQVESVNEKVNSSRIPNYAVILGFATVAITIFGTVYAFVSSPINKALTDITLAVQAERGERLDMMAEIRNIIVPRTELAERNRVLERDLDSIRTLAQGAATTQTTRTEFEEFKRTNEATRNSILTNIQQQIDSMEAGQDKIRDSIVPRGEHERVWLSVDARGVELQRQIDELKAAFGGTYNLRDFIFRMNERLDKIETYVVSGSRNRTRMPPTP